MQSQWQILQCNRYVTNYTYTSTLSVLSHSHFGVYMPPPAGSWCY